MEIKIAASKIADDNGLSPLTLIALVRCGDFKVYDKFEKPIDLAKHEGRFSDTFKTDEERWGEYLRAFEFDDVDLVKSIQMKYESEKAQPLINVEFEFIKENYYFEKSGIDKRN